MDLSLFKSIQQLNPWLDHADSPILDLTAYQPRGQEARLLQSDWDKFWTILVGPRQVGKTTLAKYLCHSLVHKEKRFTNLLYLDCDNAAIRQWLTNPAFLDEALSHFSLANPILFIDEVQCLSSPGLLLKSIVDRQKPIKLIASGSSQLELKSKVQEHLTGRQLESLILPFSYKELDKKVGVEERLIYGCYPGIVRETEKQILLRQLYQDYINKDIIEILRVNEPDNLQRLLGLLAHSSGQLVNYNQLGRDCNIGNKVLANYLNILEQTYVIKAIRPFVGNKRTELTSNPIYYFIDNGFRNQALRNFTPLETRSDAGLLVESAVFQEIYKYQTQNFLDFDIHYWRTKGGAEVDFVLYQNDENLVPIDVRYQNFTKPAISRGYRSFLEAYQPKTGIVVTKNYIGQTSVGQTTIHFVPFAQLPKMFSYLSF